MLLKAEQESEVYSYCKWRLLASIRSWDGTGRIASDFLRFAGCQVYKLGLTNTKPERLLITTFIFQFALINWITLVVKNRKQTKHVTTSILYSGDFQIDLSRPLSRTDLIRVVQANYRSGIQGWPTGSLRSPGIEQKAAIKHTTLIRLSSSSTSINIMKTQSLSVRLFSNSAIKARHGLRILRRSSDYIMCYILLALASQPQISSS